MRTRRLAVGLGLTLALLYSPLLARAGDEPGRILNEVAAFKAFAAEVDSRCEEPPVATELSVVGAYNMRR